MIHLTIDPETGQRLAEVAARTGNAPDELARRALLACLEDLADYATAVEAWREFDRTQTKSTEEMLHALGVED